MSPGSAKGCEGVLGASFAPGGLRLGLLEGTRSIRGPRSIGPDRPVQALEEPASRTSTDAGFSLLEMVISLAIFGILMVGAFTLYAASNRIFYRGMSKADSQQNARTALEAMTREIRMSGFDPSGVLAGLTHPTPIQTGNASSITLVTDLTADGTLDQISYQLSGTTLTRSASAWNGASFPAASTGEIASGVSSLTFSYFDTNDAAIAAPVSAGNLASIERITVSLQTTQTTSGQQQVFPLVEDVKLRN